MINKKAIFTIFFIIAILLFPKNIYASTPSYSNRHTCQNFELAGAHTDGNIAHVSCHNSYSEAYNELKRINADDLIIIDERNEVKIVYAQYGLVDLTVNELTYFYETASLNTRIYTSINTSSSYGGVDAAFIDTNKDNYAAKVKIANFTGWIAKDNYQIIPLNWVKSSSSYSVTNEDIRHNYISNILSTSSNGGRTIGPKPEMLNTGTYYSYDGHYFYKSLISMLKDYKNNTYQNAVNSNNPYYNYYMYLSNHTKTTYSSINIDYYTRNALGYTKNVYGDTANSNASRLYGEGIYFYNAQSKYGINAILSYSLSRNETSNGRSNLAVNKNNGFGLNAVDSSPTESANYYASFSSSILGYASKWVAYGYSYATDWRYFGPAFGDKYNGMNVKYATDAYWSEKMAANYYSFDKYYGLNDYNYYQLGVVKNPTNAYLNANTSKFIYEYPEAEDQLVIVGEEGEFYKVVSDINIDANGNFIGNKTSYQDYNWDTSYVYVKKCDVKLINKGKNGFISPNSVTNYQDSNYSYDLHIENTYLKPKVAQTTKQTNYYYDSSLTDTTNEKVLKDKLVMVYNTAYNENGEVVSYLITSNYMYDQKHWVSKDSIKFVSSDYGKQTVNIKGAYEWVCSKPIDNASYKIGGAYTNSYMPIISKENVNGISWLKVPVSLDSNDNSYGYILETETNAHIDIYNYKATNNAPVITASDKKIIQGETLNKLDNVSASDVEDGNLTDKIIIESDNVNTNIPGTYEIIYSVTDKDNAKTTKTINVVVEENQKPEIVATDQRITQKTKFNELENVSAKDFEDGDLTNKITVIKNTVDVEKIGIYEVIYQVKDSFSNVVEKTIKIEVVKDQEPVITAFDKKINLNSSFNELTGVTSTDEEDGDLTKKIEVVENNVDTTKLGTYKVIYKVVDSFGNSVEKEIKVEVVEKELIEKEGRFDLEYLQEDSKGNLIIKGYSTIDGINNDLNTDISYKLVFENIENNKTYEQSLTRIESDSEIPYDVASFDSKNYKYSWFTGKVDIDDISDGDYKIYIKAESDSYYSKNIVNNQLYSQQVKTYETNDKYLLTRNNYFEKERNLELIIRSEELAKKTTNALSNQYGQFEELEFTNNNKLYIYGNAFNSGLDLSNKMTVERTIIFENIDTYQKYEYKLNNTNDKLYNVKLPVDDKYDKDKAWYKGEIDISNINPGTYAIYITTVSNLSDIGELNEQLFRNLSDIKKTINNKTYQFNVNYDKRYRVELIVTEN